LSGEVAPSQAARSLAPSANASVDLSKKADWAHQVIQELPDFYHVLSPSGYFLFASESIKDLAGYAPEELIGRSITEMLHADDVEPFVKTFNQSIATKTPLSIYARFRKKDGRHLVIEFTGHARYGDAAPDSSTLSSLTGISTNSPSIAKCFFAMGRLYPAKNTALLDSYLEHKIENERLKSRAKDLYLELGEDVLSSGVFRSCQGWFKLKFTDRQLLQTRH
jgi:PAS domain S-box-containing protein